MNLEASRTSISKTAQNLLFVSAVKLHDGSSVLGVGSDEGWGVFFFLRVQDAYAPLMQHKYPCRHSTHTGWHTRRCIMSLLFYHPHAFFPASQYDTEELFAVLTCCFVTFL